VDPDPVGNPRIAQEPLQKIVSLPVKICREGRANLGWVRPVAEAVRGASLLYPLPS
jgi:hypothetical protein